MTFALPQPHLSPKQDWVVPAAAAVRLDNQYRLVARKDPDWVRVVDRKELRKGPHKVQQEVARKDLEGLLNESTDLYSGGRNCCVGIENWTILIEKKIRIRHIVLYQWGKLQEAAFV